MLCLGLGERGGGGVVSRGACGHWAVSIIKMMKGSAQGEHGREYIKRPPLTLEDQNTSQSEHSLGRLWAQPSSPAPEALARPPEGCKISEHPRLMVVMMGRVKEAG